MEWDNFPSEILHSIEVVKCERCNCETYDLRMIVHGSPWNRKALYLCDRCYYEFLGFLNVIHVDNEELEWLLDWLEDDAD